MPVLKSQIQTGSAEFKANAKHHEQLNDELEARIAQVREGGGNEAARSARKAR